MKSKHLILLTTHFPFGYGEPFLETEIIYLAEEFEKVIIISNDVSSDSSRPVPTNCHVLRLNMNLSKLEKIRAFFGKNSIEFIEEEHYLLKDIRIRPDSGIRNTMLVSLYRGMKLKKYILKLIGNDDKSKYVCYSYWCSDNALGLSLVRSQFPEIKAVSRAHGWDLYFEASSINYLPFRKKIVEGLSELFTISKKGYDYIQERWYVDMSNTSIRRLGTLPQKMNPTTNNFLVVSCSNIIPLKRVGLIAKALGLITDLEIEWVHFGGGESNVLNQALNLMPSNIKVRLMGNTSNVDVLEWYRQNSPSLFINVSTTEGIPVSIMEALSFGIPVVATDVGGTSEIVNNVNGYLINSDFEIDVLATIVRNFFQLNSKEREDKRLAAIDTWKSLCDAEVNYSQFAKHLIKKHNLEV